MPPPPDRRRRAQTRLLSAGKVLALTAPPGMTLRNWNDYLAEAYEAQSHPDWADPWAKGSVGWSAFVDVDLPDGGYDEGQGTPVDRTTFRRYVSAHLPEGRPGTISQRGLALALAEHAHPDGSQCFPSAALLAHKLGNSRQRVNGARLQLAQDGWLIATGQRQGRALVYRLSVPAHLLADDVTPAAAA